MTGSDMGLLFLSFMRLVLALIGLPVAIVAGLAYAFAAPAWLTLAFTILAGVFISFALVCHVVVRIAENRWYKEREAEKEAAHRNQ